MTKRAGKTIQTKIAYVAVYRTSDYGGRTIADSILYEDGAECEVDSKNDDNFVTVGVLTWEE
jgi:hypothetical protein